MLIIISLILFIHYYPEQTYLKFLFYFTETKVHLLHGFFPDTYQNYLKGISETNEQKNDALLQLLQFW